MMPKKLLLSAVLVLVLAGALSASAALAATNTGLSVPDGTEMMRTVLVFIFGDCSIDKTSCIPESWMTWSGFMQFIIFPFIAVFVVMYGILSEIRIFHEVKVKAILALVMALVSGSWALSWMRGALIINSWVGTVGFAVVMFIGILLWAFRGLMENAGWGRASYDSFKNQLERDGKIKAKIADIGKVVVQDRALLTAATAAGDSKSIKELTRLLQVDLENLNREREKLEPKGH